MIIKEFRVVLPISVEEYRVGQLYAIAEASKIETGAGQGVEVLANEPYEKDGEKGQYTHKIYHMNCKMPKLITMVAPKGSLICHEKAWNAYPYCRTIITNEYMKDGFLIKIETWHKPDLGEEDNVHGLDAKEWKKAEVVHIDIADTSQVSTLDYNPDTDPAIFKSEKTGRSPLGPDWKKDVASDPSHPHMCAYKLVTVHFKWRGFQNKVENYIQKQEKRMLTLFHRQLFCWIDKWIDLSMDDIRLLEAETKKELDDKRENGHVWKVCLSRSQTPEHAPNVWCTLPLETMSSVLGSLPNGPSYVGPSRYAVPHRAPHRPRVTIKRAKGRIAGLRRTLLRSHPYPPLFSAPARPTISAPTIVSINPNSAQGLTGLRNLGNTCFMNSILQCLSNTQSLRDYCLNNSYSRDLNSCTSGSSTNNNNTVLMQEFAKLIRTMWMSSSGTKVVSPSEFKAQFTKSAPMFEGLKQHDAHEFLHYLLDGLHKEVNRVTVSPNASDEADFDHLPDGEKGKTMWSKYLERENSKIVDLFAGQLKSSLTCSKCGSCATVFDPFWTLSLPITEDDVSMDHMQSISLIDCMRLFSKEDILDGDEEATCHNCKARGRCTKKFTVQKFPKILVLHLKRFPGGHGTTSSKPKTFVSFPVHNLDLHEFASENSMNAVVYNLHAVSTHEGTAKDTGHYTAYCRNPTSGQWYTFDDSRVKARELHSQVRSLHAYVLFYELASRGCEPSSEDGQLSGVTDELKVMESNNTIHKSQEMAAKE